MIDMNQFWLLFLYHYFEKIKWKFKKNKRYNKENKKNFTGHLIQYD